MKPTLIAFSILGLALTSCNVKPPSTEGGVQPGESQNPVTPPPPPVTPPPPPVPKPLTTPPTNSKFEGAAPIAVGAPLSKDPKDPNFTSSTTAVTGVLSEAIPYRYYTFKAQKGDRLRITAKASTVFADSTLDPIVRVYLPNEKGEASKITEWKKGDHTLTNDEVDIKINIVKDGIYTIQLTNYDVYYAERDLSLYKKTDLKLGKDTDFFQLNIFKRPTQPVDNKLP